MEINVTPKKTISVITECGISQVLEAGKATEVNVPDGDLGNVVKDLGGKDNTKTKLELKPEVTKALVGTRVKINVDANAKYTVKLSDNLMLAEKAPKYTVVYVKDDSVNPSTLEFTAKYGTKTAVTKKLEIPVSYWNAPDTPPAPPSEPDTDSGTEDKDEGAEGSTTTTPSTSPDSSTSPDGTSGDTSDTETRA